MHRSSVATLVLTLFISSADAADIQEISQSFPIEFFEPLVVTTDIAGEKCEAILDTACPSTVFEERFRPLLGPVTGTKTMNTDMGWFEMTYHRGAINGIGLLPRDQTRSVDLVACCNLSLIGAKHDREIDASVGMDILCRRVIRINYDTKLVTLVTESDKNTDGYATKIIPSPAMPAVLIPQIRMRISDEGFEPVGIDTNDDLHLGLEKKLFDKLLRKKRIVPTAPGSFVRMDQAGARSGILDEVELGPYRLRNVEVCENNKNEIGQAFLQRFETELDFPHKVAYFRPGRMLHDPTPRNLSGIEQMRLDKKAVVTWTSGIGLEAGINKNDVITHVNGDSMDSIKLTQLRQLQSKPDTDLKITLERDGKSIDVVLHLVRPADPFPDDASSETDAFNP